MIPALHLQKSGVPVYVQIRDQMLQAIGAGALRPGEQMPTMRQVAVALKVDLNTVRHAYSDLEQTGAIVILRARGTYVAEHPPALDATKQARRVESLAQQAIAMANAAGVDPVDVAREITQALKQRRSSK
jgi:GntR family transcriptional regulator